MFNDILGDNKERKEPESKDSIIEALKDNIESKNEMIHKLLREITKLEREFIEKPPKAKTWNNSNSIGKYYQLANTDTGTSSSEPKKKEFLEEEDFMV